MASNAIIVRTKFYKNWEAGLIVHKAHIQIRTPSPHTCKRAHGNVINLPCTKIPLLKSN
jgi:hypothetical protein